MVTVEELKALLERRGWSIKFAPSYRQRVVHAQRREGGKVATRYLATEHRLEDLTEADIIAKLERPPKTQQS